MASIFSRISKGAIREVISNMVWSYWPVWGVPVMSALFAYVQKVPVFYGFIGVVFSFCVTVWGLNNLTTWRNTRSAAYKVRISKPIIAIGPIDIKTKKGVKFISLGLSAINTADFPMEIQIDSLETRISDRVPKEGFFSRKVVADPRNGVAQFTNGRILLDNIDLSDAVIDGFISGSISYGKLNNIKYSESTQWHIRLSFKEGNFVHADLSLTEFTD